ncbi:hypothetical protein DIZ81_11475 [Legionella taurinensis]|uniref:Amidohydrolase-related domain-containing protein n=1 Tax=Legionella taurinensis TaxID=70611 RepID=A0A3A5L5J5_9GAMM|nr:DUF6282 family protein [Legionella taurinensis]MDX1838579.1 DUF6282 family protein [Legionella taurinensis]PUT39024.1 hypothetical protein DB744_11485 [Legionella taurinensis]PUT41111.1 hypothetical protein DB746_09875 [Legionella taurinensis]PUT43486.1 hypothetical protein DB743_10880 [Legionella taurinensis]PUT46503.1 hypothetical protein DB745_10365 [Legionella taurinensis]
MLPAELDFIDIHYHANPDLYERKVDALTAGRIYQSLRGAVVLTSHLGATSVEATLAQKQGLPVFPSLILNHISGGIHYRAVLQALAQYQPTFPGKMIVHFPTITGRHYRSRLARQLSKPRLHAETLQGETLFNDALQLRPEVIDILKMAKDYPIVLSTGHASKDEVYALIDACVQHDVPALLLNQPANPLTHLQAPELASLSDLQWLWIEQTLLTYLLYYQDKEDFADVVQTLPRIIYSSDLGQSSQIDIHTWHEYTNTLFHELALPASRQTELRKTNPLHLLGII